MEGCFSCVGWIVMMTIWFALIATLGPVGFVIGFLILAFIGLFNRDR